MTKLLRGAVALATMALSACTIQDTQPPPLTGPSEMSLSLSISANPDVLSLDGSSQALITIEARDHNGQPAANVPLRVEILADGQAVDYGAISTRTLVTGSNGRATLTYTAPMLVGSDIPDLALSITPTGSGDAANHQRRLLSIRLVPPGIILPGGLTAAFTYAPGTPTAHQDVLFDASQSRAGVGAAIVSYSWTFGDGSTASGVSPVHRYGAGSYTATLTVRDSNGLTASTSQLINVGPGTNPTAAFVSSPVEPVAGAAVFFNAGQSVAGPGRRIVSYRWSFGDGDTGSGVTRSHTYDAPGGYVVLLTVTDDVGQVGTASATVTVCPATGCEDEEDEE